jgi:hypothetical protein
MLTANDLDTVCFAVGQPCADAFGLYLNQRGGLFVCQHFTVSQANRAAHQHGSHYNALLLEGYDFDSSFLDRHHNGDIIRPTWNLLLTARRLNQVSQPNPEKIVKNSGKDSAIDRLLWRYGSIKGTS